MARSLSRPRIASSSTSRFPLYRPVDIDSIYRDDIYPPRDGSVNHPCFAGSLLGSLDASRGRPTAHAVGTVDASLEEVRLPGLPIEDSVAELRVRSPLVEGGGSG